MSTTDPALEVAADKLLQEIEEPPPVEYINKMVDAMEMDNALRERLREELLLRRSLTIKMRELAERARAGDGGTWAELSEILNQVAEEHGIESGIPLPQLNSDTNEQEHPLVLATRSALGLGNMMDYQTEAAAQLARSWRKNVRNSWHVLGDSTVSIVDTEKGPMYVTTPMAGGRLRKIMDQIGIHSDVPTMTAEAELKALESLKGKIGSNQYRTYVLGGAFVERSPRSDLFYVFRKGRPTLATSFHGAKMGRCIAALCWHPWGYYQFSHVGVMCPTDEVIAALLTMRADERRFWAKSGQWSAQDPRSGI